MMRSREIKELSEKLKQLNERLDMILLMFGSYQQQRLESIVTDEDLREYRALKEITQKLKEMK